MPSTDNVIARTSNMVIMYAKNRTGTWKTCLLLHALLVAFYIVWFLVGVTVTLWVEIPVSPFGRIVQYVFGPATLLGGMLFYIALVGTTSLVVFCRRSFFTSTREKIVGALYLLCIYALGVYASNIFYLGYRPGRGSNPSVYILQMNVGPAVLGFLLSLVLLILAVVLLSPDEEASVGAIQLPGEE